MEKLFFRGDFYIQISYYFKDIYLYFYSCVFVCFFVYFHIKMLRFQSTIVIFSHIKKQKDITNKVFSIYDKQKILDIFAYI